MAKEGLNRTFLKDLFDRRRSTFSLRTAPLIDIIFLLLIFFLVTAKWRPAENFLPLDIPAAAAGSAAMPGQAEPLLIEISHTPTGCIVSVAGDGIPISEQSESEDFNRLAAQITACMEQQNRLASDPVEIACDAKARWQYVARLYNLLYSLNATDITFRMTE